MTAPLSRLELTVLQELLDHAHDGLSSRGCNDFNVPNSQEMVDVLNAMEQENVGPGRTPEWVYTFDPAKKTLCVMDFSLLGFLTKRLMAHAWSLVA